MVTSFVHLLGAHIFYNSTSALGLLYHYYEVQVDYSEQTFDCFKKVSCKEYHWVSGLSSLSKTGFKQMSQNKQRMDRNDNNDMVSDKEGEKQINNHRNDLKGIDCTDQKVINKVRIIEGCILSPALFNVYVDGLSEKLCSMPVGFYINYVCYNHLI